MDPIKFFRTGFPVLGKDLVVVVKQIYVWKEGLQSLEVAAVKQVGGSG